MASLFKGYWYFTLAVSALAGVVILLRKITKWRGSSGLLPEEGVSEQFKLPRGVVMMQLSSPLCFASLSRFTGLVSERRSKGAVVVILRVRADYPLAETEMVAMDYAADMLVEREIYTIIVSNVYRASRRHLTKDQKRCERLFLVQTVEQALEAVRCLMKEVPNDFL